MSFLHDLLPRIGACGVAVVVIHLLSPAAEPRQENLAKAMIFSTESIRVAQGEGGPPPVKIPGQRPANGNRPVGGPPSP